MPYDSANNSFNKKEASSQLAETAIAPGTLIADVSSSPLNNQPTYAVSSADYSFLPAVSFYNNETPAIATGQKSPYAFNSPQAQSMYQLYSQYYPYSAYAQYLPYLLQSPSQNSGKGQNLFTQNNQLSPNFTKHSEVLSLSKSLPKLADLNINSKKESKAVVDYKNLDTNMDEKEYELYLDINKFRADHGLSQLTYKPGLAKQATANSVAMNSKGIGHWAYPGWEVAAIGNVSTAMAGWTAIKPKSSNQLTHRAILLNPTLTSIGVGVVGNKLTAKFS